MSFTTFTSSSPASTLSRTSSASTTTTLESAAPLTPPESSVTHFKFPFDAPANPKTICASPESLDEEDRARSLLPEDFAFPTLADVRAKPPVPYRDPFVNCRTSEDFRAVDALAAVHFAALKVQQTRESRLRESRLREEREKKQRERREKREMEGKKQRKMFEDAWMCAKGAMSVVLVSGSVLCVLALA